MEIAYRALELGECARIREIDASQFIGRAWREADGRRQLVEINYHEPDFPNGFENHLAGLERTVRSGGVALGALGGGRLVGFASVEPAFFGKTSRYALLDQLFVTRELRGRGIGRGLFFEAAQRAKDRGAEKLYICAGSSEETVAFYFAIGCVAAKEINEALYRLDPRDFQLEYALAGQ